MSEPWVMHQHVLVDVSDREETYRIVARKHNDGWYPAVIVDPYGANREAASFPVVMSYQGGPYPTPGACLEALFRAVVTELFGVKA